jgi:hypothetical protein
MLPSAVPFPKLTCDSRLQKQGEQRDFLDNVASRVREGLISQDEMVSHSWNLA